MRGGYEVTVSLGRDPETGRRLRRSKWVTGLDRRAEREAQRVLNRLLADAEEGRARPTPRDRLTVTDVVNKHLAVGGGNNRPPTP